MFTMLCRFLPYNNANQPSLYTHPLSPLLSHLQMSQLPEHCPKEFLLIYHSFALASHWLQPNAQPCCFTVGLRREEPPFISLKGSLFAFHQEDERMGGVREALQDLQKGAS